MRAHKLWSRRLLEASAPLAHGAAWLLEGPDTLLSSWITIITGRHPFHSPPGGWSNAEECANPSQRLRGSGRINLMTMGP